MFGGRTEAKINGIHVEVSHLDFSSQYPSVFTLMAAQKILIADQVDAIKNDPSCIEFLRSISFDLLFKKETWKGLLGIALIAPSNDILTLGISGELETVIVASGTPIWVTFADVAASKIMTGRTPEILETISLVSHGEQPGLTPHDLFGLEEFRIDPRTDDLFVKMVS